MTLSIQSGATGIDALKHERVLVLAPIGRDTPLLCTKLREAGLQAEACYQIGDLCGTFQQGAGAALFTSEALTPPSLKQLVESLSEQPTWSHFPLVILTRDSESAEASSQILQTLNPYSKVILLERPLHTVTLVNAVQVAIRARRRQYEIRDYLLERERQARILSERETQLRLITDSLPVLISYIDAERRYQFNNAAYEHWFGVSRDAIKGHHLREVLGTAVYESIKADVDTVLAGIAVRWERQLAYKDGGTRYVHADYVPDIDADGRVRGYYALIADITERRQIEEALRQKTEQLAEIDRRKNVFLAMLGHELRNPLGSIRSALEVLDLHPADAALEARMRGIVQRQVGHLARLVDDLLDVSRIERGKLIVRKERLDLVRLVHEAVESERAPIQARGLALEAEFPPGPLWVDADPTRLTQVIGNLLSNAKKFTNQGGKIAIRVSSDAQFEQATVSVSDTGCGIDPRDLANLFDPFMRSDEVLHREGTGLGLGLPIAKGLIEAQRGRIEASSAGKGRGSEFAVHIPLQAAPQTAKDRKRTDAGGAIQQHILVVDDEPDSADALGELLALYGYQVEVVYNGPSALEATRRFHPDVVICDIGLPGMDGYQVAEQLRRDPQTASIQLFALTGYGDSAASHHVREAGFDHHLTKPVDLSKLRELLAASPSSQEV